MRKIYLAILISLTSFTATSQVNDLQLDSAFHRHAVGNFYDEGLTYYNRHSWSSSPVQFSGTVSNVGTNEITGCHLIMEAKNMAGAVIFSGSSDTISLAVGETDSLALSEEFIGTPGHQVNYVFYLKSDSVDAFPENDTLKSFLTVDDYFLSRSNPDVHGQTEIGLTFEDPIFATGNVFDVIHDLNIASVSVPVPDTSENINELIFASIYLYDWDEETWVYMDQSEDRMITEADLGEEVYLHFDEWSSIPLGEVILVLIGNYDKYILSTSQKAEPNSVLVMYPTDSQLDTLTTQNVITMNVHSRFGSLEEREGNSFLIGQNQPNPFTSSGTSISYTLNQPEEVLLTITDLNGKIVLEENQGFQTSGEHQINLSTENWRTGVYFYTLTVGTEKQTRQMLKVE